MFDDLGATTDLTILDDKGHTTGYDDPKYFWQWIFPRVNNDGALSSENDVTVASY